MPCQQPSCRALRLLLLPWQWHQHPPANPGPVPPCPAEAGVPPARPHGPAGVGTWTLAVGAAGGAQPLLPWHRGQGWVMGLDLDLGLPLDGDVQVECWCVCWGAVLRWGWTSAREPHGPCWAWPWWPAPVWWDHWACLHCLACTCWASAWQEGLHGSEGLRTDH